MDRSPCGSGTAGRAGQLYLNGKLTSSGTLINESMMGSIFQGKIIETGLLSNKGENKSCIVEVEGSANTLGRSTWFTDEKDIIAFEGFVIKR